MDGRGVRQFHPHGAASAKGAYKDLDEEIACSHPSVLTSCSYWLRPFEVREAHAKPVKDLVEVANHTLSLHTNTDVLVDSDGSGLSMRSRERRFRGLYCSCRSFWEVACWLLEEGLKNNLWSCSKTLVFQRSSAPCGSCSRKHANSVLRTIAIALGAAGCAKVVVHQSFCVEWVRRM